MRSTGDMNGNMNNKFAEATALEPAWILERRVIPASKMNSKVN